jgi:hypothetical protein
MLDFFVTVVLGVGETFLPPEFYVRVPDQVSDGQNRSPAKSGERADAKAADFVTFDCTSQRKRVHDHMVYGARSAVFRTL